MSQLRLINVFAAVVVYVLSGVPGVSGYEFAQDACTTGDVLTCDPAEWIPPDTLIPPLASECEPGIDCFYVSNWYESAERCLDQPYANGTLERPFCTIQEGVTAATDGDQVVVMDGTYTGEGNINIAVIIDMVVRSQDGPENCIIDVEGDGTESRAAFKLGSGSPVIQGFTIRGGEPGIQVWQLTGYNLIGPVIRGNILENNKISAIQVKNGTPLIIGNIIRDNSTSSRGGGIFVHAPTTIEGNCIVKNKASGTVSRGRGGGIYLSTQAEGSVIRDNLIAGNESENHGAGISAEKIGLTIERCTFAKNRHYAGTLSDGAGAHFTMTSFTNSITVSHCTFWGNEASNGGGALSVQAPGSRSGAEPATAHVYLENVLLVGNSAVGNQGGGGAVQVSADVNMSVVNSTIADNCTEAKGGGIDINVGDIEVGVPRSVHLCNSVLCGNSASDGGDQTFVHSGQLVSASSITQAEAGECNFVPGFRAPVRECPATSLGDYRLNCGESLCGATGAIDMGNDAFCNHAEIQLDLDGKDRSVDYPYVGCPNEVDLGAYECFERDILYVDENATGDVQDGLTWCTAFNSLESALDVAEYGGITREIRVAEGTYHPDSTDLSDPRQASFRLLNDVKILGGYAGCGGPNPDEREIDVHRTVLSGDLEDNDLQIACTSTSDCDFHGGRCVDDVCIYEENHDDNAYNVITVSSDITRTAVLDGFTIERGEAWAVGGAGMNCNGCPTIRNCTFERNHCLGGGGGMAIGGSPLLEECTFRNNWSYYYYGGGLYIAGGAEPELIDCIIEDNTAAQWGGGMLVRGSSPILINTTFRRNWVLGAGAGSDSDGGGLALWENAAPQLYNCLFHENMASNGAGIYASTGSTPRLVNCTLTANHGVEMVIEDYYGLGTHVDVFNSIIWDGVGSGISGGQWGTFSDSLCVGQAGCIDDDPFFAGPGNFELTSCSPCVDAGDNNFAPPYEYDIDGNPRVLDGNCDDEADVDIGAYELAPDRDANGNCVPPECEAALPLPECALSIDCDDGNDCTFDVCVAGICTNSNAASGTACDDGLFCTETDECDGNGACVGGGNPCPFKFPKCCEGADQCACGTCLCSISQ